MQAAASSKHRAGRKSREKTADAQGGSGMLKRGGRGAYRRCNHCRARVRTGAAAPRRAAVRPPRSARTQRQRHRRRSRRRPAAQPPGRPRGGVGRVHSRGAGCWGHAGPARSVAEVQSLVDQVGLRGEGGWNPRRRVGEPNGAHGVPGGHAAKATPGAPVPNGRLPSLACWRQACTRTLAASCARILRQPPSTPTGPPTRSNPGRRRPPAPARAPRQSRWRWRPWWAARCT